VDEALFWQVELEGLAVGQALVWREGAGDPLLRSPRGPVAVRAEGPGGEWLLVGLSPARTDWPLRVGFVHFLANVVDRARPDAGIAAEVGVPAAEVLAEARTAGVPLPAGVISWQRAALLAGVLLLVEALVGLRRRL
jgi:hypothetical protein